MVNLEIFLILCLLTITKGTFLSSKLLPILSEKVLMGLDEKKYSTIQLDPDLDDAFKLEVMDHCIRNQMLFEVNFANDSVNCDSPTLFITTSSKILSSKIQKSENTQPYIKSPCLSYFVLSKSEEQAEQILKTGWKFLDKQPYIFALVEDSGNVYELQMYSHQKVLLTSITNDGNFQWLADQKVFSRRDNFYGAAIRLSLLPKLNATPGEFQHFSTLLKLVQERFNFTLDLKPFTGYGTQLQNGTYDGTVKELLMEQHDIGTW